MSTLIIRPSRSQDVAALWMIYDHHIRTGVGSFEETVPDLAAGMAARRRNALDGGYPYLVAEGADATVIGFAYASAFNERVGYRFMVEDSIYVTPDHQGKGVGRALLAALIDDCAERGFRQMAAIIGGRRQCRLHRPARRARFPQGRPVRQRRTKIRKMAGCGVHAACAWRRR